MRIEHIALWTTDLERCKQFYASYFGAVVGADYVNPAKGFTSCFLSLSDGARIEVMKTTTLSPVNIEPGAQRMGLTHIAISVGSAQGVDELTRKLRDDGVPASAKVDKICIQFNDDVNVDDFVPVMQEDFFDHGITSVVFKAEKPNTCQFTLSYTVDRWWDLAPYMVDAQMTVNKNDAFIGSAHYHMTGHGGLSLVKWAGTHSKIDPVIDEMLRNYPKVEMGTSSKTAAN